MNASRNSSGLVPTLFGAVACANIVTMSVMNFFELATPNTSLVYLVSLALSSALMLRCRLRYPVLSTREHLFCFALGLILFLPRSIYLIEAAWGYSVLPLGDDYYHLPELASMVHSDRYPPLSPYDKDQYLAYYYAPWTLGAAIYHLGLVATVKGALALMKLLYCFFISYFPVYASKVLFSEPRLRIAFLILCVGYGGFDFLYWLSGLSLVPTHSEWWAIDFGFALQFSNFITLSLWTTQHLMSALSILFALYVVSSPGGALSQVLVGLLFLFALFSSPFVVFGAAPLVVWYFYKAGKLGTLPIIASVFALVSLPLWWILVGEARVSFKPFGALASDLWTAHKRASFFAFLLIIVLELGPLIIASWYSVRSEKKLLWPFALSSLYVLSTFFCYYDVNYCMRGSIVPVFVLTFLASPTLCGLYYRLPRTWLRIAIATYLLGGVLEYSSFTRMTIASLRESATSFNAAVLASNLDRERTVSVAFAKESERHAAGWEILEKNKPIRKSQPDEYELLLMHPDNAYRVTFTGLLRWARH